jgi:hypothetical protein
MQMKIDSASISIATSAMQDNIVPSADTPVVFDYVRARGPEGVKFDVWYCNTHLPGLADEFPGRRLRRYAVPARASYLAIGELGHALYPSEAGALVAMPEMCEHRERFVGEPITTHRRRDTGDDAADAAIVYPAFLRVPRDRLREVSRWYDEEHLPMLLSCPQWVMTRRFRITRRQGMDYTHLALHYLTDMRALQSPQRDAARNTPWRDSLIAEGWFAPEYRVCYRLQDWRA